MGVRSQSATMAFGVSDNELMDRVAKWVKAAGVMAPGGKLILTTYFSENPLLMIAIQKPGEKEYKDATDSTSQAS